MNSENQNQPFLWFAPMEGVTDEVYRLMLAKIFPEWDYFSTDFLRVPTQGHYSDRKIIQHFGEKVLENEDLTKKTAFQILTTSRAQTAYTVNQIQRLGFRHLDLNLGCPSKKVNSHRGGAYLLSDVKELRRIIRIIRSEFPYFFSVKIRTGYKDTDQFEELIEMFNEEKVNKIIIHGRTRDQLYRGKANWEFIKLANHQSTVPIVGNGDIWCNEDIDNMFATTGCRQMMLGRGALKTPWFAKIHKDYLKRPGNINQFYLDQKRKELMELYFDELYRGYQKNGLPDNSILSRFKSLCRYLFDDEDNAEEKRRPFLRSQSLSFFFQELESFCLS